jgi:hypothetical protein
MAPNLAWKVDKKSVTTQDSMAVNFTAGFAVFLPEDGITAIWMLARSPAICRQAWARYPLCILG